MKQFSIRDLLLLVVIVSVALGWWIDRRNRVGSTGRFQTQVLNSQGIMIDTATGEVWYQNNGASTPDVCFWLSLTDARLDRYNIYDRFYITTR